MANRREVYADHPVVAARTVVLADRPFALADQADAVKPGALRLRPVAVAVGASVVFWVALLAAVFF